MTGSSRRRYLFDVHGGHKGKVVFSEPRDYSQGPSSFGINDEIITFAKRNTRKGEEKVAYNSAVKIEATTRREMNTSKSGKTTAQPTPSLDLDPSL